MKVLSHARYFASNFFIRSAHKTLGELNSKHAWQFLTTSILPVLKSFMKNLLTVKSSEESSDLVRAHASRPYYKLDMHLLSTNWSVRRRQLSVPRVHRSTFGSHALSVAGPTVWNSLPDDRRDPAVETVNTRLFCGHYGAFANYSTGSKVHISKELCTFWRKHESYSVDKRWVILYIFRGGHKWNNHISGRNTSFQNGTRRYWIKLIL